MLLATLNYNLPDLTDNLVEQLNRDPLSDICELMVIDNGSTIERKSVYTTHTVPENVFFGGGLNLIFDYFLQTDHDYVYVLNNDLIFHGNRFLTTSLNEATKADAGVYSPSIINASIDQCNWKQMWNWGSLTPREVKWIDFQCPLIRRDVVELIKQYPELLYLGWGNDFYTGIITDKHSIKTVVSDTNTICHLNSQTFKQNVASIDIHKFCQEAERNMNQYFNQAGYWDIYTTFRNYGAFYEQSYKH